MKTIDSNDSYLKLLIDRKKVPAKELRTIEDRSAFDRVRKRIKQWTKVSTHARRYGCEGLTLSNSQTDRWALITLDGKNPGNYKYTEFDSFGIYPNPFTFHHAEDALEAAFDAGFEHISKRDTLVDVALSASLI